METVALEFIEVMAQHLFELEVAKTDELEITQLAQEQLYSF